MIYDVGDEATVTTELRDIAGTPTDATVSISVTAPDDTTSTPNVVGNGGTGLYKSSFPVTQAGTWRYKWTASGAISAVDGGQLEVVVVGRVLVAGLDELRAQLDRSDFSDDAELRLYLEAATSQVEWLIGPLSRTTITERTTALARISLRRFPVAEIISVKPVYGGVVGSALDVADYWLDVPLNEIAFTPTWRNGYMGLSSRHGGAEYEVEYVIGRTSIAADIKLAGLIIAQHLWSVQNARFTLNAPGEDELAPIPGSGFMVPYRALELLRPYTSILTVPGIA